LAYSIYSSLSYFDDVGILNISAGLDLSNLEKTLNLISIELGKLSGKLVTPRELQRAKDYVTGQMDLSLESADNQMMWMGEQWLGYGKIIPPDEIRQRINGVKASEIRAVAREFFRPERMNLALVSPLKKPNGLDGLLKAAS
jgi:predicted Zn-dependent peptidase